MLKRMRHYLKSSWYVVQQFRGPYVVKVARMSDDDKRGFWYETISRHADERDAYDAALAINSTTLLNASVWYQWGNDNYTPVND